MIDDSGELQTLEDNLSSAKMTAVVDEELEKMKQCPSYAPDFSNAGDSDTDSEVEDGQASSLSLESCCTLQQVLQKSGLSSFVPAGNESEGKLFARMRAMKPHMLNLIAVCRVHEQVLSRAAVMGVKQKQSIHNQLQHELSLARQAFQCSAERQSRHALWSGFSQKVISDIKEVQDGADSVAGGAPVDLGPPSAVNDGGERQFQLLVVRPFLSAGHSAGGLRFAVPLTVWRCGKTKNAKSHQKLVVEGKAPIHLVTKVHVQLLQPTDEQIDGFGVKLVGT